MKTKEELIAEVQRSRAAIIRDSRMVKNELNVALKMERAIRSRPFAWLSGAAALGYMLAGPKTRTKTVTKFVRGDKKLRSEKKHQPGILSGLFSLAKFALPLLRPAFSAYAGSQLTRFAERMGR